MYLNTTISLNPMNKKYVLLAFLLFVKLSYSQKKEDTSLIEYIQRDSEGIEANILIPSFENQQDDSIPEITIESKGVLSIILHYVGEKGKKYPITDTCFIATSLERNWEGLDRFNHIERPCSYNYNYNDGYCVYGITSNGVYLIRFRIGTEKRYYKLIVKD
jgi:hypothetical protein